jgi:hypothetical protein
VAACSLQEPIGKKQHYIPVEIPVIILVFAFYQKKKQPGDATNPVPGYKPWTRHQKLHFSFGEPHYFFAAPAPGKYRIRLSGSTSCTYHMYITGTQQARLRKYRHITNLLTVSYLVFYTFTLQQTLNDKNFRTFC